MLAIHQSPTAALFSWRGIIPSCKKACPTTRPLARMTGYPLGIGLTVQGLGKRREAMVGGSRVVDRSDATQTEADASVSNPIT
jgi:hypothetical protein